MEVKKVVDKVNGASTQAKAIEVQKDTAKVKYTELEVTSTIEINKLKTDLFDSNKEIKVNRATIKKLRE